MKMLSLFSGIGGIDLAAEWAGIETIAFCEKDKFCQKVLKKHWPDILLYDDIKTLKGDDLIARYGNIDIVAGGFPCQPFSIAGKRRGKDDDRHLWPEMLRVIKEVKPTWIIGENVPGIVNMELESVLIDLENEGYETQSFIIPACAVNAPHKRARVFIVAYSSSKREGQLSIRSWRQIQAEININGNCQNVPNANSTGCEKFNPAAVSKESPFSTRSDITGNVSDTDKFNGNNSGYGATKISEFETSEIFNNNVSESGSEWKTKQRNRRFSEITKDEREWANHRSGKTGYVGGERWNLEPGICRVANGIPNRMDRLKSLGNAVVPQQIYPILKIINQL